MSRIVYYLGAGASYGREEGRLEVKSGNRTLLEIKEGLPIVTEIPQSLLTFRKAIASAKLDGQKSIVFKKKHLIDGDSLRQIQTFFLRDIDAVCAGASEHATIDTYAKRLFLTHRVADFKRLKDVLCVYFVWLQLQSKPDQRYDSFLANVLSDKTLSIPPEISVISWNYDSQFEIAYRSYSTNNFLPILDKNIEGVWPDVKNTGLIYKVNGSATFGDFSAVLDVMNDKSIPKELQLIIYYDDLLADTRDLGYQFHTHLSFAWEESPNKDKMMNSMAQCLEDTESVVVIGYSFPFFNRELDRQIFNMMPNLQTVYIQDPNPEAVEMPLRAVLPDMNVDVEFIRNCSQFFLPKEL